LKPEKPRAKKPLKPSLGTIIYMFYEGGNPDADVTKQAANPKDTQRKDPQL
jgi:hypothetical protein